MTALEAFPPAQNISTGSKKALHGEKEKFLHLFSLTHCLKWELFPPLIAWMIVFICIPLPGVMGEYEPKIEVQFPEFVHVAKGSTVKLECFALGK